MEFFNEHAPLYRQIVKTKKEIKMNEIFDDDLSASMEAGKQMSSDADVVATPEEDPIVGSASDGLLQDDALVAAVSPESDFSAEDSASSQNAGQGMGDRVRAENDQNGDGHNLSFRGSMHHFYCPVCGHTWYAPGWPSYCEKSGCLGHPKEL